MATKWAKINLQTSVIPIWKAENQGYKIGYEKSYQEQQLRPKNGSEKSVRLLSADTVGIVGGSFGSPQPCSAKSGNSKFGQKSIFSIFGGPNLAKK